MTDILLDYGEAVPAAEAMVFGISIALKVSVLLGVAGLALVLWRNGSASARHATLCITFAALLILPAASLTLPAWEVGPAGMLNESIGALTETKPVAAPTPREVGGNGSVDLELAPAMIVGPLRPAVGWPTLVLAVWFIGVAWLLIRIAIGSVRVWSLVRRARPVNDAIVKRAWNFATRQMGFRSELKVVLSGDRTIPFVAGWLRPVLVLPEAATGWSEGRLRAVLFHELAHIRRLDLIWNMLSRVVAALYWVNPLVWLAVGRMRVEQERACDDRVLDCGTDPCDYADLLLDLSQSSRNQFAPATGVALARGGQLGDRIMRIVGTNQNRARLSLVTILILGSVTLSLVLPLSALTVASEVKLTDVTRGEQMAVTATLAAFYEALNEGEEFDYIRESFLTEDYFADSSLTLEYTDRSHWRAAFTNVVNLMRTEGLSGPFTADARITAIRRDGNNYVVTQRVSITGDKYEIDSVTESGKSVELKVAHDPVTGEPIRTVGYLLKEFEQEIEVTLENNEWKIARYCDGLQIGRMDVDSPHGAIYLLSLFDMGSEITPYGPYIAKVIPAWNRPFNNMSINFSLAQ